MTNRKPPELGEEKIESVKGKRFIRDVKSHSNGLIYVYQWNVDNSETAPIGLYVDINNVQAVCSNLKGAGAVESPLQHGKKFDLSIPSGFQGAHIEIYNTGRMSVQWPRNGKDKKQMDFVNSFVDVIEVMSSSIAKDKTAPKTPVNSDAEKSSSKSSNKRSDDDDDDGDDDNNDSDYDKERDKDGGRGNARGEGDKSSGRVGDVGGGSGGVASGKANDPNSTKSYAVMPLILKNRLPSEVKQNPRQLAEILQTLKPQAKFKDIRVLQSGDIKVTGNHPHDYSILKQEWPDHEVYGKIVPMLPEENSVDQAVLILDIPTAISKNEIKEAFTSLGRWQNV